MEGNATPSISDDGKIEGLNALLQLPPTSGTGRILNPAKIKSGFSFELQYDGGKTYKAEINTVYGSTNLSVDIGDRAKYLLCLDAPPEEM
jgi:hypothetical protein